MTTQHVNELEELVTRAERILVWVGSGQPDEEIIQWIRDNEITDLVRTGIKKHQQSLSEMTAIAEALQIRFLMQQIEVDRCLADWTDYTARHRAAIDVHHHDLARRR